MTPLSFSTDNSKIILDKSNKERRDIMYKYTVKVEGMACSMCEAHMNEAVRKVYKVKKVSSSHSKGETEIITDAELSESAVKALVEEQGYTYHGMEKEPYKKKGLFSWK